MRTEIARRRALNHLSQNSSFDVVIVGGGPAGAATALTLRSHAPELSVALIEQTNYDVLRVGETLPPAVRPLLERIGVWQAFLDQGHLPAYGTRAAWGSKQLYENEFFYQTAQRGWHLDRRRLDAMLAHEAAGRGVATFRNSKLIDSRTRPGGYRLIIQAGPAREVHLDAAFVIDATGRRAAFATQQGVRKIPVDSLLGVFVFFEFESGDQFVDTYTLVEACEAGWWYSALLPDGKLAVALMSDSDIVKARGLNSAAAWFELLGGTHHTRIRTQKARAAGAPATYAAASRRLERFSGDAWLAAGDAASTFDPLSSAGIIKGLRSGVLAAYAIGDYFKGNQSGLPKYEALLDREFQNYLVTRTDFYQREKRWSDSLFWQRRSVRTPPGVLDPLVSTPRTAISTPEGVRTESQLL